MSKTWASPEESGWEREESWSGMLELMKDMWFLPPSPSERALPSFRESMCLFQVTAGDDDATLGITPSALPPERVIIDCVEPESWADQNGIMAGDELLRINDVELTSIPVFALDSLLRAGRPLHLTFACKVGRRAKNPARAGWERAGAFMEEGFRQTGSARPADPACCPPPFCPVELGDAADFDQVVFALPVDAPAAPTVLAVPREAAFPLPQVIQRGRRAEEAGGGTSSRPCTGLRAAKPQFLGGNVPVWPPRWGITAAQCRELLGRLRRDAAWNSGNDVHALVSEYLVPWTRGTGVGYALSMNRGAPKEANVMVSHAWTDNVEELFEAINRSTDERDVLFIGALSLYQAEDGAGPSVAEQLGSDPAVDPLRRVLEHIHTQSQLDLFSRRSHSLLQLLPAVFAVFSVACFYIPIIIWGCVPTWDASHCLVRQPMVADVELLQPQGHPQRADTEFLLQAPLPNATSWVHLEEYDLWLSAVESYIGAGSLGLYWHGIVATLMLLAVLSLLVLRRCCRASNGRLLVVPTAGSDTCGRLWCLHEVITARAWSVPVVLASTLARTRRCDARRAVCSEPRDVARIRGEIEGAAGKHGYDKIDRVLRALRGSGQRAAALTVLRYALLVAAVRSADLRLIMPEAHGAGLRGLHDYYVSALGIVAGTVVDGCALFYLAWSTEGMPPSWAVCLCVGILVGGGATVIFLFAAPETWLDALDLILNDCYGYSSFGAVPKFQCQDIMLFWVSLAHTLFVGGLHAVAFLVGGLCCPICLKGHPRARIATLLVVATGCFAADVVNRTCPEFPRGLPELPEAEHALAVAVLYLTQLAARCWVPIAVLWAGVARWGVRVGGRRPKPQTDPKMA